MSKQIINVGQSANDRSGDPLRNAFEKVNSNFTELYSAIVDGVNFDQVNSDWSAVSGVARILNKPTIPTNTNQLTNGAGFITGTDRLVNGSKQIVIGANGTLSVPYPTTNMFDITFSAEHYVPRIGKPVLTLTSAPWEIQGQYAYDYNGETYLAANSIWPILVNPGYSSGDEFTFDETVHGVPGFTLTVILNDVILPGGAGWTANPAFSPPPDYPSTISSLGAIKVTSNDNSWIFSGDGKLYYPNGTFSDSAFVGIARSLSNTGSSAAERVAFESAYNDTKILLADIFAARELDTGYPWGASFPVGHQTYQELITYNDVDLPGDIIPFANNCKNAYLLWQESIVDTITAASDKILTFSNDNSLNFSDGLKIQSSTISRRIEQISANGPYEIIDAIGSKLVLTDDSISLESYNDPEGANNTNLGRVIAGPGVVSISGTSETVGGIAGSTILVQTSSIQFYTTDGIADQTVTIGNGSIQYPGGITQSSQDSTSCPAGADTVIYTATGQYQHAIKLFVIVEGTPDGGTLWETQACDIIAVKGFVNDIVHVTAYGVTYSSDSALATFDGQWNATTNRIEITCRPTSLTNGVTASVHAIEMNSND